MPRTDPWRDAGWTRDRRVPSHMARNAWLGAGQPAWPTAMEAWSSVGGLTLECGGKTLVFDASIAAEYPDAPDPVLGRWGDAPISVDADGAIRVDGRIWADDLDAAIRRWRT